MANSRSENRKEARLEKNRKKHEAWLQRQKFQKEKKLSLPKKTSNVVKSEDFPLVDAMEAEDLELENSGNRSEDCDIEVKLKQKQMKKKIKKENSKKELKNVQKTKFEEYLEMDTPKSLSSAQEDLKLERRLAKKLKVKEGKLRGSDDGINELFGGFSSALDSLDIEFSDSGKKRKKKKKKSKEEKDPEELSFADNSSEDSEPALKRCKKKNTLKEEVESSLTKAADNDPEHMEEAEPPQQERTQESKAKFVAPHLRSRAGSESEEHTQARRRIRGLLNRMTESNIESITAELSTIYRTVTRSVASQIFCDEVLASCANGPRGNEQYAAVFAAFIAGMACSVGMDFSAKIMAKLAKSFEDEYHNEDNLSLRNLTLLLSYLCIFGVCSSDLIYDFLMMLGKRLTEVNVSTILTVLHCCGMKIRSDDPLAMKTFIVSIQSKANEIKTSSDGQEKINGKRMEFMLETICEIKNNKKRPKEDTVQHTRIKKWLQMLRVEEVLLRGLRWNKLIDPEKKGQWWLSGDIAAAASNNNSEDVAKTMDSEVVEAQKMLKLAATQRMNTDARKAIFCVIMSGEDYIDAFEKLLRLDLPGKQDREIMRVLVECCLQEKVFNKYYTVLASKLCEHDKNHKFTLQYCIWDHFKQVEGMSLQRSMHLAKFVGELVSSFTLSLAVLKAVDLANPMQLMSPKRIMHFRMLFEAIFERPDRLVWNVFTRIALNPDYEALRDGIKFFVREYVLKTNTRLVDKFKIAKDALHNAQGVLM